MELLGQKECANLNLYSHYKKIVSVEGVPIYTYTNNESSVCPHITNPETASLKDGCRKMKSTTNSLSYLPEVSTSTIYNLKVLT